MIINKKYMTTNVTFAYKATKGLISILVLLLLGCTVSEEEMPDVAEEEFNIVGVWELNEIRFFYGQKVDVLTGYDYAWNRIYDNDGTYYVAELATDDENLPLKPHELSEYFFVLSPYDTVYIERGRMTGLNIIDNHTIGIDRGDYVEILVRNDRLSDDKIEEIKEAVSNALRPKRGENTLYIVPNVSTTKNTILWIGISSLIIIILVSAIYMMNKVKGRNKHPIKEKDAEDINGEEQNIQGFIHSDYYLALRRRLHEGPMLKPDEWRELETQMESAYPIFFRKLGDMCQLSEVELRVCMLIKLGIPPSAIAIHTCREYSSISSIRSRLYFKLFEKKGGARDLDDFIINL